MLGRTKIREMTVEALRLLPMFNAVFNARQVDIIREHLPCCKVWTPREGGPNLSIGVPEMRIAIDLVVQIVIEGNNDETNARTIDDMCERVDLFLIESPAWQTAFERLLAVETEIETNSEGEVRTITATMTYSLQYNYLFITRIHDELATIDTTIAATEPAGAGARFVLGRQPP